MPRWETGGKCTERTGVGDRWRFEIGPLTRRALEGFRRTDAADAPPPPRSGLGPDRRRVRHRPRHLPPARAAPAAAASARRPPNAAWSTVRSSPCCFTGRSVAAEVAALCWADVDFRDGDDVVVTVRRSKSNPTGGACGRAASGRRLRGRGPQPARRGLTRTGGIPSSAGPRTAAASVSPVELTARGASTHAIQLAGGWKDPAMVVRYAASVSTREGAVSKYLR